MCAASPARASRPRTYSRACHSASGKPARPLSSVSWPSTRLLASVTRRLNSAGSAACSAAAASGVVVQTSDTLPSASGSNASGPSGRNRCQAVCACGFAVRRCATTAVWPYAQPARAMPHSSRVRDWPPSAPNDEAARDPPAVAQRDRRAVGVELERFEARAQLRDALEFGRLEQLPLHAQVLDDVPEVRLAGLGSGEPQGVARIVRARGVPDDHLRIGAGVLADRRPGAGGQQDALRRSRERRDAQVQRRRIRRAGRGGLDDRNAPAREPLVACEQCRGAQRRPCRRR